VASVTPPPPQILLQGVQKRYPNGTIALPDVSLVIPKQDFVFLVGPSGAGKSTLLSLVGGLEPPRGGELLVGDDDLATLRHRDLATYRRRVVGFVFQHYAAFKHLSVARNIAFGLEIRKRPKAEIKARVHELLELVHLEQFAERLPSQLSGGQRRRMALARALAVEPAACPTLTRGSYRYDFGDTDGMTPLVMMFTMGHTFVPASIHAGGLR